MDVEGQLNPSDFFHAQTPEGAQYTVPPGIIKDIVKRVWAAVTMVDNNVLWCAQENALQCSAVCPEMNGTHFEHLLQLLRHPLFDNLMDICIKKLNVSGY